MKYRVLIVEDNPQFSEVVASIFDEELGYEVTQVDTAREAQKLLYQSRNPDHGRFDLIITDMNLKGDVDVSAVEHVEPAMTLGGLQVLQSLRQIHDSEICVILSGQTLSMREVRRISKDYSDIVFEIIDKGDDVYSEIMGKIHPMVIRNSIHLFLSYRRQDSSLFTDRIYDSLLQEFNSKRVFRDLDSIGAGVDFREAIRDAIRQSRAVLVVIGTEWAVISRDNTKPRLFEQGDYVRLEIEEALRQNKFIIPVLLDTAVMPTPDQLPVDIVPLAYKNAIRVRQGLDFANDMKRLIEEIEKSLSGA